MSEFAYPVKTVLGDFFRAGIGMMVTGGALAVGGMHPLVTIGAGIAFALFVAHGTGALVRYTTRIEVTDQGIVVRSLLGGNIQWQDLKYFRMAYYTTYTTRRDRDAGWLQLSLGGGGRRIKLDSTLDEFSAITVRAATEAARHGIRPDPATLENLSVLGITYGSYGQAYR